VHDRGRTDVPSMVIDEVRGRPQWGSKTQTKAEFTFATATGLLAGDLTVELIEMQLVAAANELRRKHGYRPDIQLVSQVQKDVSPVAAMWIYEIKRVVNSPGALEKLVEQAGRGLTTLYREIGSSRNHSPYVGGRLNLTDRPSSRRRGRKTRLQTLIKTLLIVLNEATPEYLAQHDVVIRRAIARLRKAQKASHSPP